MRPSNDLETRARPGRLLHAFSDESVRRHDYMICAAVLAPSELGSTRRALRRTLVPGSRRIHMIKDGNYRDRYVSAVAELGIQARLYVTPISSISQRQARSKCLRSMVPDLLGAGVTHLIVESCDQDRQDSDVLVAARALAAADETTFHFDHYQPHEEPMLWAADVIAWAYGRDSRWRHRVAHLIADVVDVAA